MDAQNAGAAAADDAPQQDGMMGGMMRSMLMFMALQSGTRMLFGSPQEASPKPAPKFDAYDSNGRRLPPQRNLWDESQTFDVHVYTSCAANASQGSLEPLWSERGLSYDYAKTNGRARTFTFTTENATLRGGARGRTAALTKFHKPPKNQTGRSLLSNETVDAAPAANASDARPILYWKPTLVVRAVSLPESFPRGNIPDQISRLLTFDKSGDFLPPVHVDEFWLLHKSLVPVNDTLDRVTLTASLDVEGLMKWQIKKSMEQQWASQRAMGLQSDGESDVIREMLSDTEPWLLALTCLVSMLHMVFEGLAFKNNVKFWRNKKTLEGLSARTIALNCVFQLVILLYLLDNDTSWMILISSSMGLFTEVWKLSKAVKVRRDPATGHWGVHCEESYAVSETKEYDDIATRHLLRVVAPLLLGYSAYSLVTGRHKGWYSWLVGSCVGFIYAFGFVMMTPQLYINYRLKSVEHLPWRAMVYKSLNTFIDDLFAFIIKMPTMHRLSCLRDDVIFVATLYQRYIYRVDYTRINEFGQGGVDPDADKVEAENAVDRVSAYASVVDQPDDVAPEPVADDAAAAGLD
ncbi:apoptotic process [Aureococcus anophagefferens]|nr:apoptotic process [Aureococcus anophagefferens]